MNRTRRHRTRRRGRIVAVRVSRDRALVIACTRRDPSAGGFARYAFVDVEPAGVGARVNVSPGLAAYVRNQGEILDLAPAGSARHVRNTGRIGLELHGSVVSPRLVRELGRCEVESTGGAS